MNEKPTKSKKLPSFNAFMRQYYKDATKVERAIWEARYRKEYNLYLFIMALEDAQQEEEKGTNGKPTR